MEKYLDKITPQVSDTWRADELYVKIRGNMKYVFAMMDDETRFWIAQEVANTKESHDARHLFQISKERAGKKPHILITDGLRSYHEAWMKEFRTQKLADTTVHIRNIKLEGTHSNNKTERLNGGRSLPYSRAAQTLQRGCEVAAPARGLASAGSCSFASFSTLRLEVASRERTLPLQNPQHPHERRCERRIQHPLQVPQGSRS